MSIINRLLQSGREYYDQSQGKMFHGTVFKPKIEPLRFETKTEEKEDKNVDEPFVLEAFLECESFTSRFSEYHELMKQQTKCYEHSFISGERFCNIAYTSATYGISKIVFNIVISDIPSGDDVTSDKENRSLSNHKLITYTLQAECEFEANVETGAFGLIIKDGQVCRGFFNKQRTVTELHAKPYGEFEAVEIDGQLYDVLSISIKEGRAWIKCAGLKGNLVL